MPTWPECDYHLILGPNDLEAAAGWAKALNANLNIVHEVRRLFSESISGPFRSRNENWGEMFSGGHLPNKVVKCNLTGEGDIYFLVVTENSTVNLNEPKQKKS